MNNNRRNIRQKLNFYLVLKYVKGDIISPSHELYMKAINSLPIVDPYYTYEYDSKGKLHYNIVFQTTKFLDYKKFNIKGFHTHIQFIKTQENFFKVMRYIHKDYRHKNYKSEEYYKNYEKIYTRESSPSNPYFIPNVENLIVFDEKN